MSESTNRRQPRQVKRPTQHTVPDAPYGYCPFCGARGVARTRGINGYDHCEAGHRYLSRKAVQVRS